MDLLARQQPPSLAHWFGTDQMGRDLWLRTFQGTLTSLELGISTALCSGLLAMVAASVSLVHPRCDVAVRMVIDAMLALPHMLLLILDLLYRGGWHARGDPGGGAHPLAQAGAHSLRRSAADRLQRLCGAGPLSGDGGAASLAYPPVAGAVTSMVYRHLADVSPCGAAQRRA